MARYSSPTIGVTPPIGSFTEIYITDKPDISPWIKILKGLGSVEEVDLQKMRKLPELKKTQINSKGLEKFNDEIARSRASISEQTYATATVTSLTHKDTPKPEWIDSGNGMHWGTVIHRVLNICKSAIPKNLTLVVQNILAEEEISIDRSNEITDLVATITSSPLWKRMKDAKVALAEVPFVIVDNSKPVSSGKKSIPTVISGAIDLLFKESDGWVLVDYKTDTVAEDIKPWVDYYKPQLDMYAKQWEEMTKEKVKERILFFTSKNEIESW